MNLTEHHLVLLMEECAEVAQRASKQLRFGRDEVQPGQSLSNGERLREELLDVYACVEFLVEAGEVEPIDRAHVVLHMANKEQRIASMLALSRTQGRLDPLPGLPMNARPCACTDNNCDKENEMEPDMYCRLINAWLYQQQQEQEQKP